MSEWLPIADIAANVNAGKTSASDLVKKSLKLIENKSEYESIIAIIKDRALVRAKEVDHKVQTQGSAGCLAGVPFIAKDNFLAFGAETTAASNMLKGFNSPYQATVIDKLESEGAICVAKANLDAFAHGASGENSDFMITKNPHDKTRVPGGSSAGSAAATALELAPFSIGTDTGGSVRLPASFCGVVGYKPTYGLVSRSGIVAMSSSSDVAGPLAKTVDETALILDVISGRDELDGTTIKPDRLGYANITSDLKGKKIGVVKEYMDEERVSDEVGSVIKRSLDKLAEAGAKLEEVSLPATELSLPAYYIIVPAEIASNLSRYDGQRYPYAYLEADNLEASYTKSRANGFGLEAKRRIIIGNFVLSSGFYEAYYGKAQLARTKIINEFDKAFKQFDFLVGPTAAVTAFPIGEIADDPLKMYLTDTMTAACNLAGIPAISLPAGMTSEGLPVGLHIMGSSRSDRELLAAAKASEGVLA